MPTPTSPTLLGINHDGPIIARHHGDGIRWTVQPEDFPAMVDRVNATGGPTMWTLEPM